MSWVSQDSWTGKIRIMPLIKNSVLMLVNESVLLDCLLSGRRFLWSSWALFCWSICFYWLWQEHLPGEPHFPLSFLIIIQNVSILLSYLHWGKAVFSDFSGDETELATYHRQHRCDKKLSKNSKLWTRKNVYPSSLSKEVIHVNIFPDASKTSQSRFLLSFIHWLLKLCILILQ